MHPRRFLAFFSVLAVPTLATPVDLGKGRPGDYLHVHHPPDPVNVRNGNFYLPTQDYFMACFGFPLEVYRSYNSVSTRNGPFGRGWTFNYDLQIAVDEGEGMTVAEADGFINEYTPVESDLGPTKSAIDAIVDARRKEDVAKSGKPEGKGEAAYEQLRRRLETEPAFLKNQTSLYLPKRSKVSPSGKYVSHLRGSTMIEKTASGGYLRTTETGRKEEYNPRGQLIRLTDRNGNELTLTYNREGRLQRVTDGCGQWLDFTFSPAGKIVKIADILLREISYEYDKSDRMISVTALDGEKTRFAYDNKHRMTSLLFMDGTRTDMTYDPKTGAVTQQSGPGTKVTTYTYGREPGKTWAVVGDNEGGKTRYEYLDAERKIVFIDREGKKTITTVNACCSKPVSVKNEKGIGDTFAYDAKGNLVSKTNSQGQKTSFSYEPRFNLPSEIRLHDGSYLRFVYDKNGNLALSRSSTGEHVKIVNEAHGKIASMTDHRDITIRFEYNRFGKPTLIEKSQKGVKLGSISIEYDKTGEISKASTEPKKPEVMQQIKESLAAFLRFLKPSGIDFEI
jgi:YD repeat-containing protein